MVKGALESRQRVEEHLPGKVRPKLPTPERINYLGCPAKIAANVPGRDFRTKGNFVNKSN